MSRLTSGTVETGALIAWYERVKRPLPWRATRDPYAILVSEVMLQQTQAARVVPHYERFLGAFPTVEALAHAEPAEVLRLWSGLGYNRRALKLREAAQHVAAHGWPADLTDLPGVGPYTAAAVASFAFGADLAAVDVNYKRVAHRHGSAPPPTPATNQAMMELGATVCTARNPRCSACPVERTCAKHPDPEPRRRERVRFEDTDRYLRGRTVAALLDGDAPPPGAERVMAGLERDGLVIRDQDGEPALPRR
jgi:A/G-specific adenine glycosylase